MKKSVAYTWVALILAFSAQAGCAQEMGWSAIDRMMAAEFSEVRQISTDSLAALLKDEAARKPVLLDVRPEAEYAVSHLAGAIRVDPGAEHFGFLDSLRRSVPIVTYCSVGYRSAQVAARLGEAGFTNVSNLKGSIFRWANEGRPVYRDGVPVRQVHPYDELWGRLLKQEFHAYEPKAARDGRSRGHASSNTSGHVVRQSRGGADSGRAAGRAVRRSGRYKTSGSAPTG